LLKTCDIAVAGALSPPPPQPAKVTVRTSATPRRINFFIAGPLAPIFHHYTDYLVRYSTPEYVSPFKRKAGCGWAGPLESGTIDSPTVNPSQNPPFARLLL
jgi:hypothetical protein